MDQVKQTADNQNPISRLGEHGLNGGPGRPKGSKNKFTSIKEQMLEVWEEENGKNHFKRLFHASNRDFIKALELILSLMPKELCEQTDGRNASIIYLCKMAEEYDKGTNKALEVVK